MAFHNLLVNPTETTEYVLVTLERGGGGVGGYDDIEEQVRNYVY